MNTQTKPLSKFKEDDIWVQERCRLMYVIEGLTEELAKSYDEVDEYSKSYERLRALIKTLRYKIKYSSQKWFVHGVGMGTIVGYWLGLVFGK